jgi:thioredoxin-related protein
MLGLALAAPAYASSTTDDKVPAPAQSGSHALWVADYDQAVEIAKKEHKDLFVDFTGSDWCGWCIKLHKEVFDHDEFLKPIQNDFVLVSLDFPKAEAVKKLVPNPKRNAELQDKYDISGFPTILLMTVDGDVFGQTGYQPGGPEKYIAHINELREKGKNDLKEVLTVVKSFESATGTAKDEACEKAIARLEKMEGGSALAKRLVPVAKYAFTSDPDNKAGRKMRAVKALLTAQQGDEEVFAAARALDPKNELGLLEQVVKAQCDSVNDEEGLKSAVKAIEELDALGPIKDKKLAVMLYASAAFWNHRFLADPTAAKRFAQKAKDIGADDEDLLKMLDEILSS